MKIKLIIFAVIVLGILILSYFLFFKKPSTGSVVPATAVKQSTGSSSSVNSSSSSSASTGIGSTPPTQTGTKSAVANQDNVPVFDNNSTLLKRVNNGTFVGVITGVSGNVTYVNFAEGGKGWVTSTQVDTEYF